MVTDYRPNSDYWVGYKEAIKHVDLKLKSLGDDGTIRRCRAEVLALIKVEYDPKHLEPEPKWPNSDMWLDRPSHAAAIIAHQALKR